MAEIIDNSPCGLVDALCERISKVLGPSFWQAAEQFSDGDNEAFHAPYVHAQYLPVSKTESEKRDKTKDYPFVQVICSKGTISDFSETAEGSEIDIPIYFNGWNDDADQQGWRIPMLMLERVKQDLLSDKIIAGYRLTPPLKWTPLNSKEPPYYTALMETVWKGCPPAVEVPEEKLYGDENEETTQGSDESGEG